jgi:hypothetical protein
VSVRDLVPVASFNLSSAARSIRRAARLFMKRWLPCSAAMRIVHFGFAGASALLQPLGEHPRCVRADRGYRLAKPSLGSILTRDLNQLCGRGRSFEKVTVGLDRPVEPSLGITATTLQAPVTDRPQQHRVDAVGSGPLISGTFLVTTRLLAAPRDATGSSSPTGWMRTCLIRQRRR